MYVLINVVLSTYKDRLFTFDEAVEYRKKLPHATNWLVCDASCSAAIVNSLRGNK